MKKRFSTFIPAVLLIFCILSGFASASALNVSYADDLHELGLFMGTNNGYELDKPCDRLMGAVLLTRFLGLEDEALNATAQQPFTDAAGTYADKYISYLYSCGLTQGISSAEYGKGNMTAPQFATFMLRALGYQDKTDFSWNLSLDKLCELKIISDSEKDTLKNKQFLRDDAVFLCYKTLFAQLKDSTQSLANKLLYDDVFSVSQLDKTQNGGLMVSADMPDLISNFVRVDNDQDFIDLVRLNMRNGLLTLGVLYHGKSAEQLKKLYQDAIEPYSCDIIKTAYSVDNNYIYIDTSMRSYYALEYYYKNPDRYQKSYLFYRADLVKPDDGYISLSEWVEKANSIVGQIIKEGMTEADKVKAIHDYIATNVRYEKDLSEGQGKPHFGTTAIFEGWGVCDAYSEAFKILTNAAGIDCSVVYGTGDGVGHAWNQVKINGVWYNIDVTWDDTYLYEASVYYGYFCKSDAVFYQNHTPDVKCHVETCSSSLS